MPIDWQWAQLHLIKELRRPSPFFSWAAQLHKAKAQLAPPDGSPNGDMEDMLLKDVADIDKVINHYIYVYIYIAIKVEMIHIGIHKITQFTSGLHIMKYASTVI
jgi:hypothetical protein